MSQTKEEIEVELQEFKNEHPDWKSVEWKSNTVTGFNNRLASFSGFHNELIKYSNTFPNSLPIPYFVPHVLFFA